MNKVLAFLSAFSLSLTLVVPALAQGSHQHMHHGSSAEKRDESASSKAFRAANEKMHKDMDIPLTGNADIDFMKGMIPHHEGAVEMAKIVLKYGKDPETRKLAQEIIAAQAKEIAFMRDWLKRNEKR